MGLINPKNEIITPYINNNKESHLNLIYLKNITNFPIDSCIDYSFCIFKSINDLLILICSKKKSIISYNLNNFQKLNEIKNAHNKNIISFRHIFDKYKIRDIIISVSSIQNNVKLWSFSNWECLYNYIETKNNDFLFSACFLDNNYQIFILTSKYCNDYPTEKIKVYDLNGEKIKEINNSNEKTIFIDSFFDNKTSKHFIITGNKGYVKSYDFDNNKEYHKYSNEENHLEHYHHSIAIVQKKEITKMFESDSYKYIRIWDFHSGMMLKIIEIGDEPQGIFILSEKYLLIGNLLKIKIYDFEEDKIIKDIKCNNTKVLFNIKVFFHPKLGECMISQNFQGKIKLWIIKYNK